MIAYTLVSLFLFFMAFVWATAFAYADKGKQRKPDCFTFLFIAVPILNFITALPVAWIIKWSSGL